MSNREALERHFNAVSRLLAVLESFNVVGQFKRDWATADRHAELLETAVERVGETLAEVDSV